jgi:plastocyanin
MFVRLPTKYAILLVSFPDCHDPERFSLHQDVRLFRYNSRWKDQVLGRTSQRFSRGKPFVHAGSLLLPMSLIASITPAQASTLDVQVRDADRVALTDTVISLKPIQPPAPAQGATAVMDQHGLKFVPQVLVVQRGTTVVFPNSDQVRHHVYSFSPAKKFELRLYKDIPAKPVVFDQEGVATIGCNIHDWMLGYIVVVDTPLFGKTGSDGKLRIEHVPAGEYDLHAWHARMDPDAAAHIERVRIDAESVQRDLVLDVNPPAPEAAPPSELEQKFRQFRKQVPDGA